MTQKVRAMSIPVFFYVAVTLGVPVVRGAGSRPGFLAHATTLLLLVTAVSAAWTYLSRLVSRVTRPARP
jgi:hypothetical protein